MRREEGYASERVMDVPVRRKGRPKWGWIERRDCWKRRHRAALLGRLEATCQKQQPHINVGKDADEGRL